MMRALAQRGADKGLTAEWTRTLTVPLADKVPFGTGWEGAPPRDPAEALPGLSVSVNALPKRIVLGGGWPSRIVRAVPAGSMVRCSNPAIPLALEATVVDAASS
ncbi:MAG: hypothetical protein ACKO5K_01495 [Armatimonadota bacterium]